MLPLISKYRTASRRLPLLCLAFAGTDASQAATTFSAVVNGNSQIVEVLDPSGPVVRVATLATGSGTPGPLTYHSGDVINLANGQGKGNNRFVAANGDELFGSFSVQMVPGKDPSLFDLIGEVVFDGGTGAFSGASGTASFLGNGQFVSPTLAMTHFTFEGNVSAVPEAGSGWLLGSGLAGCVAWLRRQRGRAGAQAPQLMPPECR